MEVGLRRSLPPWLGQSCKAVSCQKEGTTDSVWGEVYSVTRGKVDLLLRNLTWFQPLEEQMEGLLPAAVGSGREAGALPHVKLRERGLTVWRVPCSALPHGGATADWCIWPTYSSHRRGQSGLDYLSELLWPTWGIFRKTLGSLSLPLASMPHGTSRDTHIPPCMKEFSGFGQFNRLPHGTSCWTVALFRKYL